MAAFAFWYFLVFCGIMSKIPAGYLFVVLILPFLSGNIHLSEIFMTVVLQSSWSSGLVVFYLGAISRKRNLGLALLYGYILRNGAQEIVSHAGQAFEKFYFAALNYIGFSLCIGGLILIFIKKQKRLLCVTGLCSVAFFIFILKAGFAFIITITTSCLLCRWWPCWRLSPERNKKRYFEIYSPLP